MTEHDELTAERLESACRALLAKYPDAGAAAVTEAGTLVTLPQELRPSAPSENVDGRSALDLVSPADRVVVIAAWGRARDVGAARTRVHLVNEPDAQTWLHFFDLREKYDVIIAVLVPEGDADDLVPTFDQKPLRPRICHQRKNEIATFLEVDDAVTQLLGWSAEEMVGQASLDFVHPEDQERAISHWMEMLLAPGGTRRVRLRHKHKNGTWIWLELANHNQLADEHAPCVETEAVDISDEMAAQDAVRARERLLHRIAETMPLGLLHVDSEGRVLYTNERLHQIVGRGPTSTVDAQLANVTPEDKVQLALALETVLGAGSDTVLEVGLHAEEGERRVRLQFGALKGGDGELAGAVICVDDVTEQARLHAELQHRAEFDALTDCHNRSSVMTTLHDAHRVGDVGVIFIDLDDFKNVNDDHGHAAGDALLRIIAERLRNAVRHHDVVGRLGGDEFLIVCPSTHDASALARVADRIAAIVAEPVHIGDQLVQVQASIGVALGGQATGTDRLVADADHAMYASKRQGMGRPVFA